MIFSLSVSYFGFHCLRPWPYWITLTGPIFFQNCLRDYVNEYGHFEKYGTKKKDKTIGSYKYLDNPSIKSCSN